MVHFYKLHISQTLEKLFQFYFFFYEELKETCEAWARRAKKEFCSSDTESAAINHFNGRLYVLSFAAFKSEAFKRENEKKKKRL